MILNVVMCLHKYRFCCLLCIYRAYLGAAQGDLTIVCVLFCNDSFLCMPKFVLFLLFFAELIMSKIKSVCMASDKQLVQAHKDFHEWKKKNYKPNFGKPVTNFGLAQRHYKACRRAITRNCGTFTNAKSYATALATTFVSQKKIYWQSCSDVCWSQADRQPPPEPRNKAPVRVVYDHNKDEIYL